MGARQFPGIKVSNNLITQHKGKAHKSHFHNFRLYLQNVNITLDLETVITESNYDILVVKVCKNKQIGDEAEL